MFKPIVLATALISTLGAGVASAAPVTYVPAAAPARTFAPARPREVWQPLGELRLGGGARKRSAVLVPDGSAGPVQKLRFVSRGADLASARVLVTFGNGQTFAAMIHGDRTTIDLPGDARNIRSIQVDAAGLGRRSRTTVQILGERDVMPRHAWNR